jgi:hypothetical protein
MFENKNIIQWLKPTVGFSVGSFLPKTRPMKHKDFVSSDLTVYYQMPAQNLSHRQVEGLLLEES